MLNPSISVAMTTFNGARYLAEQLASLSSQTLKPLELVVCDDASTDETLEILQLFSALAPFTVKIYQNAERLGYKQNFMKAVSLCNGSLIALCDQDDIWNDNKLYVIREHFIQSRDLLVAHDYSVFFEDGRKFIPSFFSNLALSGLLPVVNLKGCSLTFRRELIDQVGWPSLNSNWSHDMWVCFMALLLEKRCCVQQSLIKHRIHKNNTSGWLTGNAKLHRLLRNFQLPPFTSSTDLDAFISQFAGPADLVFYSDAVEKCGLIITNCQRQRALSALARRRDICAFVTSECYLHPFQRAIRAMTLFLGTAYCDGDGMLGLVQDILGRRTWMRTWTR